MPEQQAQLSLRDIVSMTVDTVKAVEAVYPATGHGKDKFDAVYAQVMAFAPLATVAAGILEQLLPVFINNTVAIFNKIGVFKKVNTPSA